MSWSNLKKPWEFFKHKPNDVEYRVPIITSKEHCIQSKSNIVSIKTPSNRHNSKPSRKSTRH